STVTVNDACCGIEGGPGDALGAGTGVGCVLLASTTVNSVSPGTGPPVVLTLLSGIENELGNTVTLVAVRLTVVPPTRAEPMSSETMTVKTCESPFAMSNVVGSIEICVCPE